MKELSTKLNLQKKGWVILITFLTFTLFSKNVYSQSDLLAPLTGKIGNAQSFMKDPVEHVDQVALPGQDCSCINSNNNLITNPSFENGTNGWSYTGNFYSSNGYEVCGANNAYLQNTSSGTHNWAWQEVPLQSVGAVLNFKGYFGTHAPGQNCTPLVRIAFYNSNWGYISGNSQNITTNVDVSPYQIAPYTINATVPANTQHIRIEIGISCDYVKMDAFCLTVANTQNCSCAGNMVLNPSFENGTNSWSTIGGTLTAGTGAVKCGSYSGDFQITDLNNNRFYQTIGTDLPIGTGINATVWAGTHNLSYQHRVVIGFYDANWNFISSSSVEVDKVLSAAPVGPKFYSWRGVVPPNCKYTIIGGLGTGDWIKTDQWCVTQSPSNTVSLGDEIFADFNGNGIRDGADIGLDGVASIRLYADNDDNGIADGPAIDTTVASDGGKYYFTNLTPGKYFVQLENVPSWAFLTPTNGGDPDNNINNDNNGLSQNTTTGIIKGGTITLSVGGEPQNNHNPTYDFALFKNNGLGDYVFLDANQNGIQDVGEQGLANVTVRLRNTSGTLLETTTTDANGYYYFFDPAQKYQVVTYNIEFVTPSGYIASPANQGSDDNKDSDPVNGVISNVNVPVGTYNRSIDAGFYINSNCACTSSSSNLLTNASFENGTTGWSFAGGNLTAGSGYNVCGANGGFLAWSSGTAWAWQQVNATPGASYTASGYLGIHNPGLACSPKFYLSFYDASYQLVGRVLANVTTDVDVSPYTLGYYSLTASAPATAAYVRVEASTTCNTLKLDAFCLTLNPTGSIGDRVWFDANGNGIQDASETTAITGVTVQLKNASGTVIATTTTDANGNYLFSNLPAGNYTVVFPASISGAVVTTPNVGADDNIDSDADQTTGATATITLAAGQNITNVDAGYCPTTLVIGNFVWYDKNNNGTQDAGEPGINGATVKLYADNNNDNLPDGTALATTTTNATGNYTFANLAPGNYIVGVVLPSGYVASTTTATSASPNNDNNTDNNGLTTISGELRSNNITLVAGTEPTNDGDGSDGNLTLDFGLTGTASIGDFVWNDLNGNGLQDAGEPGISGVTVRLVRAVGDTINVTTNANGAYFFSNLAPGTYSVIFPTNLSGYSPTASNVGANDNIDSDPVGGIVSGIVLAAGQNNNTIDAGYVNNQLNLGNQVWSDLNNNGIKDAGEPGISGIIVRLHRDDDNDGEPDFTSGYLGIASTTTDANGNYNFTGLTPGNYIVSANTPLNFVIATVPASGTNANNDTDNDNNLSATAGAGFAISSTITLTTGGEPTTDGDGANGNLTVDFGFYNPFLTCMNSQRIDNFGTNTQLFALNNIVGPTSLNGNIVNASAIGGNLNVNLTGGTAGVMNGYTVTSSQNVLSLSTGGNDVDNTTNLTLQWDGNANATLNPTGLGCVNLATYQSFDFIAKDDRGAIAGATITYELTLHSSANNASRVVISFPSTASAKKFFSIPLANLTTVAGKSPVNLSCVGAIELKIHRNGAAASETGWDYSIENLTACTKSAPAAIGNFVFNDANGNGIQDNGEVGIPNATVQLTNNAGIVYGTTTTDANGAYSFTNLVPGTYNVTFTTPAGYTPTVSNVAGSTEANDSDPINGVVTGITLTAGQTNNDVDAGFYQPVNVGNIVWYDRNNNGTKDAGEPIISGATVRLYLDANNDNTVDGAAIATTTTDASGIYSFGNLAPNNYIVGVVIPTGYAVQTINGGDPDNNTDNDNNGVNVVSGEVRSNAVTLTAGAEPATGVDGDGTNGNLTVDFGFKGAGSIGDFVWDDQNGNGVQDGGEPGIPNATVTLTYPDGTTVSTTTNASGIYSFDNLAPGTYSVTFGTPTNYTPTASNVGANDNIDSDPVSGVVTGVVVNGAANTTVDAGFYKLNVGNIVWYDRNNNGLRDAGEPIISGTTVNLYLDANNDNTVDGAAIATTTTDASGIYNFGNLAPNNYIVGVVIPTGYAVQTINGGDPDNNTDNDNNGITVISGEVRSNAVTLSAGAEPATGVDGDGTNGNLTVDFGFKGAGSIGDFVWDDQNGNGIQDAGEPGIPNATVTLTYPDGTTVSTTTNASGIYSFDNLAPSNNYTVTFSTPANYNPAAPNVGANDNIDSDPVGGVVTGVVVNGAANTTVDAGFYKLNVGNQVWYDRNNNGLRDAGEPIISGATVRLFLDANNDNTVDGAAIATTTTDASGIYNFGNLAPNNYIVGVVIPTGYAVQTINGGDPDNNTDNDNNGITVVSGEVRSNAVTLSAGAEPATGVDGDGANGNLTVDFGFNGTGSIGDFVWLDANANGLQDAGEVGIANATVTLTFPDGSTTSTTTNGSGAYTFDNLAPGTYSVTFTTPSGYVSSPANVGSNDNIDSDPVGGVVSGVVVNNNANTTVDAGFYTLVNVGNYVWYDRNNNGTQDATEPGVANATVRLYKDANNDNFPDGASIATTTTDANGMYNFGSLVPTNYIVGVVIPNGYSPAINTATSADPNNNNNTDNNGTIIDVTTNELRNNVAITLTSKGEPDVAADTDGTDGNLTLDFGLIGTASLGNFVWEDLNRNGIQDANEPGIANATVTLTRPDGSTSTTTTNASGNYGFNSLIPGTYSVTFTTPTGTGLTYTPTLSNQGSDDTKDSDPVGGIVSGINLSAGQVDTTIDAGFYKVVTLQGNVWHDVNGMDDNLVNNSGPLQTPPAAPIPLGLRVIRVNPSTGLVVANAVVNASGAYNFGNVVPGPYILILSTVPGTVGQLPPFPSLPNSWINTGEKLGLTPGRDALVDGKLSVNVVTNTINANFAIKLTNQDGGID